MIETQGLKMEFTEGEGIVYRDLQFETGKSYALLGASGCGKSTLLNIMAGVLTPTQGGVFIDGRYMTQASRSERDAFRIQNIGYIFQDFKLIEEMTVKDNIDILKLENVDVSAMDEILEKLGILGLKKRRCCRLSGGEKQRVAIARALVKKPEIILADEPTGNLNYAVGRRVMEALLEAAHGKTLICVTHDERLSELFDVTIDMNQVAFPMEKGGVLNV